MLFALLACPAAFTQGAERRALLVAIDSYSGEPARHPGDRGHQPEQRRERGRREWTDLQGAVNDAESIRQVLVSRYGFEPGNVHLLTDADATRDGILRAMVERLVTPAREGDACLFYYAGHGSRVPNRLSPEADGLDETRVPHDSRKGIPDIRDKELARIFNDILDKGARLTAIFDSCHSASAARGLPVQRAVRALAASAAAEVEDAGDPRGPPEERGAIIISASQESQSAEELIDENGVAHGAFTWALLKALRSAPAQEPLTELFSLARSYLLSQGGSQEPVLAGCPAGCSEPLFGLHAAVPDGKVRAIVHSVAAGGEVEILGGRAAGIAEGSELETDAARGGQGSYRLRVVRTLGLTRSLGVVESASGGRPAPGDSLVMVRWASGDGPLLRIWMPPPMASRDDVLAAARELAELRSLANIRWVVDPIADSPTHTIRWSGSDWTLTGDGARDVRLGRTLRASGLARRLAGPSPRPVSLYAHLPPTRGMVEAMALHQAGSAGALRLDDAPRHAAFVLAGRLDGAVLSYAWVRPNAPPGATGSSGGLPLRTHWVPLGAPGRSEVEVADELAMLSRRLARIQGWLQIESPPATASFPYRLLVRGDGVPELRDGASIRAGTSFELLLSSSGRPAGPFTQRRYVYLLALDSDGAIRIGFPPRGRGNVENHLPALDPGGRLPEEIRLVSGVAGPPFGATTFILVTTSDPLPDPGILESRAVWSERSAAGAAGGLERLLGGLAFGARSGGQVTPLSWSIQRLTFDCRP